MVEVFSIRQVSATRAASNLEIPFCPSSRFDRGAAALFLSIYRGSTFGAPSAREQHHGVVVLSFPLPHGGIRSIRHFHGAANFASTYRTTTHPGEHSHRAAAPRRTRVRSKEPRPTRT